jgi:hypothetical protein
MDQALYVAFWITLGIAGMFVCALGATYWLWGPWFLNQLAQRNYFVTIVEENTGKWIMRFGRAWRFVTSDPHKDPYPAFSTEGNGEKDVRWNIEKPLGTRRLRNAEGEESWLVDFIDRHLLPGGMRWVGLPFVYTVYRYNFRWSVLRESEPPPIEDSRVNFQKLPNGKWEAVFAKNLDYIYLKDAVYFLKIIGAETRDADEEDAGGTELKKDGKKKSRNESISMSLNVFMLATIRIIDPYRALFLIHDWLEATFDLDRPAIRKMIAGKTYAEVINKPEVAQREFDTFLKQTGIPEDLPAGSEQRPLPFGEYIECTYGVRQKRIAFDDVVPPEEYQKAATARASAIQRKIETITMAEAERDRQTIIADGEAQRIEKVTAVLRADPIAMELRRLEALEHVGDNGNMVVVGGENANLLLNTPAKTRS